MKLIQHRSFNIRVILLRVTVVVFILTACKTEKTDDLVGKTEDMFSVIAAYNYGDSRSWLQEFEDLMKKVYNTPQIHAVVEQRMIFLLQSENVSIESKSLIAPYLGMIGTRASVLTLGEMLLHDTTSDMARIALERIPDPKADEVLRGALRKVEGKTKVGIINSIAARQDPKALELLAASINDSDKMIEKASINALGKIGGEAALDILTKSFEDHSGRMKWIAAEALLQGVHQVDDPERQLEIYKRIYSASPPVSLGFEAFEGILKLSGSKGALMLEVLQAGDAEMQEAVIPLIRELPASAPMNEFVSMINQLPDQQQLSLLLALADRGAPTVRPMALQFLKKDDTEMRKAGLNALMKIGTADDVLLIANIAAESAGKEKELARVCLNEMQGDGIDQEIVGLLAISAGNVKSELIRSIGYRNITAASSDLMTELNSNDPTVRSAAIKTLSLIAPPEYLSDFIDLTVDAKPESMQGDIVQSITNIANRIPDHGARILEISSKIEEQKDPNAVSMLILAIGNMGDQEALTAIRPYLSSDIYEARLATAQTLSQWPDASAMHDLKLLFDNSDDSRIHTLALKGYVQSVLLSDELNQNDKASIFEEVYPNTISSNEKAMVITGFSRIESMVALNATIDLLKDKEVDATQIEQAIMQIAGNIKENFPEEVGSKMIRAAELSDNEEFKTKVQLFLKSLK